MEPVTSDNIKCGLKVILNGRPGVVYSYGRVGDRDVANIAYADVDEINQRSNDFQVYPDPALVINDPLVDALAALANARATQDQAKGFYESFIEQHPEYELVAAGRIKANKLEKEAADRVRQVALEIYTSPDADKVILSDVLGVRLMKSYQYDRRAAVLWLLDHFPEMVQVDDKAFQKMIAAAPVTAKAAVKAELVETPTITIAQDFGRAKSDEPIPSALTGDSVTWGFDGIKPLTGSLESNG